MIYQYIGNFQFYYNFLRKTQIYWHFPNTIYIDEIQIYWQLKLFEISYQYIEISSNLAERGQT